MNNIPDTLRQTVLDDNGEILRRLTAELQEARTQILVATAWFTNPDLLQELLDAVGRGVNVRVITEDNTDGKKLDFDSLERLGANVYKLSSSRFRGMRQKFCVIDQRIAFHGYSWTINATLNTQQSVLETNHADTIEDLTRQFSVMERFAMDTDDAPAVALDRVRLAAQQPIPDDRALGGSEAMNFQAAYTHILDQMIAAEVCNFDRGMLRQQGYDRAEASRGDAQVLNSAMDSLYSVFINDINIVEDKRKRLVGKISEQKVVHAGLQENSHQSQLRAIEDRTDALRKERMAHIAGLKVQAESCKLDVAAINDQKLTRATEARSEIEARIQTLEQDSVKTRLKWHELIPVSFLGLGLLLYLVLFYSSAVYILLFSERDVKSDLMSGMPPNPPQVFEPKAFSNILDEGGYALAFVALFVFLPLAVAVIGKLAKGHLLGNKWVMLLITVLLDGFIAYKVSAAIYQIKLMTGDATTPWHFAMAFTEPDFYLVFVLGSLGLLIFNALFFKLHGLFEERSPDVQALQRELRKQQEQEMLNRKQAEIAALKEESDRYSKELFRLNSEVNLLENEIAALPRQQALATEKCTRELETGKRVLNDVTAIYIARIENDILPISVDAIKDRINVFLEGWTNYLNDEYAEAKAIEKSRQAIGAATAWQEERRSGSTWIPA